MKKLVILFLVLISVPLLAQRLGDLKVEEVPDGQGIPLIVTNPSEAILVVHSKIPVLSFESNMGIRSVDNPDPGEYRLHLNPGTHIITFKANGFSLFKRRYNIQPKNYREVLVDVAKQILAELPVNFIIDPPQAKIEIDGQVVNITESVKLSLTEHTIKISAPGFVTITETFTVDEKNTLFKYQLEKPKLCVVEISTNPSGAEVEIDGVKLQGTTPISDFYNSGRYSVKITRDKCLPIEETIFIDQSKEKNSFSFKLESNTGILSINTNSGALVFLNGDRITELKNIELSPQTVKLRVEKTKCDSRDTSLVIRKGANEIVNLYLVEQLGTIAISVDPVDAQIDIKGDAGEHFTSTGTKIFENIPVGGYELEVSAKGYKTDKTSLRLNPDMTERKRIFLDKLSDSELGKSTPDRDNEGGQYIVAQDFYLKDLNDTTVRLMDYRGKVIILNFWATWCPPCVKEIPHFNDLVKEYQSEGLAVIGVSVDQGGLKAVKKFVNQNTIDYIVVQSEQTSYAQYQSYLPSDLQGGIPFTFVIDRRGNIREYYVGYRSKEVYRDAIIHLLTEN